jgi:hypothetical protein
MLSKIADEILEMGKLDQEAIQSGSDQKIDVVISKNTSRLKKIISEYGFVTISQVGKKAAHWAWLIIQHSDHDPAFQLWCLDKMKTLPPNEIHPNCIAYLEDRVRKNHGKPQVYGTQFIKSSEGKFQAWPIENPDKLDELRAKMGLNQFEQYRKEFLEFVTQQLEKTPKQSH